jgi:hypothetical protein
VVGLGPGAALARLARAIAGQPPVPRQRDRIPAGLLEPGGDLAVQVGAPIICAT